MPKQLRHTLRGTLAARSMGKGNARRVRYTVLYLSDELERSLDFASGSRLRIEGELEGEPVALAFVPAKGSNHYMMVSNKLLERIDRAVGDPVTLRFDVTDPDKVVVPPELQEGLDVDEDALAQWERLTPGRKRSWAAYVDRAKRPETRRANVEEVVDRMRRGLIDPRDRWPSVE